MEAKPKYKRVLLKISGEALAGEKHSGLDFKVISDVSRAVGKCAEIGVQVGVVIGQGDIQVPVVKIGRQGSLQLLERGPGV